MGVYFLGRNALMELNREPIDSQKLIDSIKRGEKDLLKSFYLSEAEAFKNWLAAKFDMKNVLEATDVYQDAILILTENIRKGLLDDLKSSVKTYLYAIGKHILLKQYNKRIREEEELESLTEHIGFLQSNSDVDNQKELKEQAKMAVEAMEEPCKSILIASYYERLSAQLIADRMNYKNESVVRNQKKRCMDRLKKSLAPVYQKMMKL